MNFFDTFKSNSLSKWTLALLSGLIVMSSTTLEAHSLPKKLGPLIRISPIPGPANPDPILQNLQAVMDNHYQLPFYPGLTPFPANYLGGIYYMSNNYIGNGFNYNPCNDRIMHISLGQNVIVDLTGTFQTIIGSNTFATSVDGGLSWSYGPPIEQIIPLGGTISQNINASLGPGLFSSYAKNGRLYGSGQGFFDMIANPPNQVPMAGFIFTSSDDNGKHWAAPSIVMSSDLDWCFNGGPYDIGVGPREFYITPDRADPDLLHASTIYATQPDFLFGNLLYFRSENAGKTFSSPRQVYSMVDDPVWQAKHFDPDFISDPNYFLYGGFSISSAHPVVVDQNVLLLPILRQYPRMGSPTYSDFSPTDMSWDQAVVRSLDNGKTWCKVAGATDQYFFPFQIYDPGFVDPRIPVIINGFEAFGFFGDDVDQESHPVVSPSTGRLYLTYAATNPASNPDFVLQSALVLLSASSDQGATFSHAVKINATPTNIPFRAQQAFGGGTAITQDGYLVVAYYDFRNWTGFPGEDLLTTPLPTDAWLAVYKETDDPKGGSTGVGLDFVGEIRLTPQSFNARIIATGTSIPYVAPFITGTPEGIPILVNNNNELYVVFSMQSEGSPSNITTGYKGMTIDTNGYITLFLQRFKFPNSSNQ